MHYILTRQKQKQIERLEEFDRLSTRNSWFCRHQKPTFTHRSHKLWIADKTRTFVNKVNQRERKTHQIALFCQTTDWEQKHERTAREVNLKEATRGTIDSSARPGGSPRRSCREQTSKPLPSMSLPSFHLQRYHKRAPPPHRRIPIFYSPTHSLPHAFSLSLSLPFVFVVFSRFDPATPSPARSSAPPSLGRLAAYVTARDPSLPGQLRRKGAEKSRARIDRGEEEGKE